MPRARDETELSGALLSYLATGEVTAEDPGLRALTLDLRVFRYLRSPASWPQCKSAIDEVRALWEAHRDEIAAAAEAATDGKYLAFALAVLDGTDRIERGLPVIWGPREEER